MPPRSALAALSLALLASAVASTTVTGPATEPDPAASPLAASLAAPTVEQGRTEQGMVTGSRDRGVRPSRASSREALAAAAGGKDPRTASKQRRETGAAIAELAASAEKEAKKLAQDAWQLPLAQGSYRLSAEFGQCSGLWAHCHTGLDFAAPSGTPIRSVAGGVVTGVGWAGAYGNRTIVTLKDGTETWFCHQLDVGVRVGDNVFSGQVIGRVGSTGNSTGPHLHLEVRPGGGDAVDPADALAFHGATP